MLSIRLLLLLLFWSLVRLVYWLTQLTLLPPPLSWLRFRTFRDAARRAAAAALCASSAMVASAVASATTAFSGAKSIFSAVQDFTAPHATRELHGTAVGCIGIHPISPPLDCYFKRDESVSRVFIFLNDVVGCPAFFVGIEKTSIGRFSSRSPEPMLFYLTKPPPLIPSCRLLFFLRTH